MIRGIISHSLMVALLVVFLGACAQQPSTPVGQAPAPVAPAQVLRYAIPYEPTSLDPAYETLGFAARMFDSIYSTLVRQNGAGQYVPDLAKSWDVTEGGRAWTFHLRDDVVWHKGYGKFTARDVKYTVERIKNPATKSPWAADWANITSVDVVDDNTVRINLKDTDGNFLLRVSGVFEQYIVNQKAVEQFGDKYGLNPVGTGPFVFERYVPGQEIVVSANKDYFLGPPKLQQVVFKPMPETAVGIIAFDAGEIDALIVRDPDAALRYAKDPNVLLYRAPPSSVHGFGFNLQAEPFNDLRMRQAIAYAIDKKAIGDFWKGIEFPIEGFLPAGFTEADPNPKTYPYDTAKAKALFAESGWRDTDGDGVLDKGGKPLSFDFPVPNVAWKDTAVLLQDQVKKVGVDLKLQVMETAAWETATRSGKYVAYIVSRGSEASDPDVILDGLFNSKNWPPGRNSMFYKNPEVDRLLNSVKTVSESDKRIQMYVQAQKILSDDLPLVPVEGASTTYAQKKWVKGLEIGPARETRWLWAAYIEPH